jgi:hypothetical protein
VKIWRAFGSFARVVVIFEVEVGGEADDSSVEDGKAVSDAGSIVWDTKVDDNV